MGTVTLYDAERMKQIEDTTVVDGHIDAMHHLILETRDGSVIDAGDVASTVQVEAEDSPSVDVTVTGEGSDAVPYKIKAEVKKIPASAVDSGRFDLARIPDQTAVGLLEASYRGGPAKIKIDGALSTDAYPWMTPYQAGGSREVSLLKTADSWKITGQTENSYPITLNEAGWSTYGDLANVSAFSYRPRATLLPSGVVILSGLLSSKAAPANGSIIGYVPPELAPDFDTRIAVEMADQNKSIYITTTGAIQAWGGFLANQYVSLDGVAWVKKGVATWTPLGSGGTAVGAKFEVYAPWSPIYGPPAYWKDPYGFVWFQGLLRVKEAINADDPIFSLPTSLQPPRGTHYLIAASDTYGAIGFNFGTNNMVAKSGSPSAIGNWYSLAGFPIATIDSFASNPWKTPRAFVNGWTNYNPASFTPFQYLLREDGLRITSGLISGGTVGTNAIVFPEEEYWPRYGRLIIASMATNARARIDLSPAVERTWSGSYQPGAFILQQGSATWYSVDSRMWAT